MKEVVCFFLKGREFGVDVSQMKTIANETTLVPRDGLPEFVKGIVDIHGEQIPLLDYEQLFTIPDSNQVKPERRYVVFNVTCGSFAIECDGISEIVSVEDSSVQNMPGFFYQDQTNYADCMIQKKNKALVLVMNPNKMLTKEQAGSLKKIIDELEEERREAERKRIEEERRRKEEEKRQREEELARMNGEETKDNPDPEKTSETPEQVQEDNNE